MRRGAVRRGAEPRAGRGARGGPGWELPRLGPKRAAPGITWVKPAVLEGSAHISGYKGLSPARPQNSSMAARFKNKTKREGTAEGALHGVTVPESSVRGVTQ